MRAQFATIEAGVSLVLIASAISFASAWTAYATAEAYAQSASLRRSMALYDILNALGRNATYNDCISLLYLGDGSCAGSMQSGFAQIFEAKSVAVGLVLSTQPAQDSTGACTSMRLYLANVTANVCASVTSG